MKIFFSIICILHISIVASQNKSDIEILTNIFKPTNDKVDFSNALKDNKNELEFISSSIFLFYKVFVSSQDAGRCPFHISCSLYAHKSIKKYGMFIGLINAFDRVTRCNTNSPEQYHINITTGKFIDEL